MVYESYETVPSKLSAGVVYRIRRVSFGRRLELMRRVRELAPRLECFRAGSSEQDRIEARILSSEIDQLYLTWGLEHVEGLEIDGKPADPATLAQAGPENLCMEAVGLVKAACRLSEPEIKN
jgi:hypothetical protein